jgi:hypothetical protein
MGSVDWGSGFVFGLWIADDPARFRIFLATSSRSMETLPMKRFLVSGLGAALLLAVVGCGGGTIEEGAPPSLKPDVPLDTVKADMGATKINPNKLPKGSETGEPVEKKN